MSRIDNTILKLERLDWPRLIVANLSALHRQYGEPEPERDSLNQYLEILPFIAYKKVGHVFGYEKAAVDAYNKAVVIAYSCIGWEFVGLCSALAFSPPKTRRPWHEYVDAGKKSLDAYFLSDEAFDDFDAYILQPAIKRLEV